MSSIAGPRFWNSLPSLYVSTASPVTISMARLENIYYLTLFSLIILTFIIIILQLGL